ncbi:MAG: DUF86 domain-containing protein [Flavobacteriia bacterium]|nr:DUF86 domain-containing protein [Flavobacteriia bacterium]OIP46369.1 MAG: hypothetical protein AUK46_09125 [Flavobacteriaceae bacterium CG2_30_31_66]PIV95734.1 MAG: hypothetical protein COW43_12320 [Flavobacteriaceae bacterium CG17_big_fil_post_rev_8_21_14_2_50_31_13]PIX14978.1 MAG: hypothetical protein COZ74_01520 [Flavobacteriaceae bacterium CG_4_8_14_3_um_filter_31_8]PIY15633.1 MAG: hypothetical protein COZ16_03745 [Flavobacteriaceae bacterium CG_4_10_14_3_um_filter_31_253]PIZ09304.1 MAG
MEQSKKLLSDISIAIGFIEEFTIDIKDFNHYIADSKTQNAVERQLVIIVEALNKLKKLYPNITIENHTQIIAFRNRLVHAYDSIDHAIVWAILHRNLKNLKNEIDLLV